MANLDETIKQLDKRKADVLRLHYPNFDSMSDEAKAAAVKSVDSGSAVPPEPGPWTRKERN